MLLRDLIDIPEHVHQSDYVLRLTEGIASPQETLGHYVVTEQLCRAFGQALDLVKKATSSRRSAGAYLHGSFGSGKSHFMAVLHLLLDHNRDARSIPELAPVVAGLDWARDRRFLLVPYHLMGVTSLEQAILGGYVERVRALHPEAPLPAVYLAEPIFENARDLRRTMGDEAFFARLNEGAEDGGWGTFQAGRWQAESFESALAAPPGDERRRSLVRDVVQRLLPAVQWVAASDAESFVPLDQGLSELSKHAKSLGYDALVLFLDELMLWLASHVSDLAFINREGSKLAKLVEAQAAERPVPIISFIARQRDLRELVGEHLPGAERLSLSDTLKWSDGRFERIGLEDRNLPEIASKRLLVPRDEAARLAIDAAFAETERLRPEVRDTLLGEKGTREVFRAVYPFSPALVQTLVAVSSVLQRERTALRVMLQLLVEGRDRLRLGDVVPVGDLYDVIASGDEPFTEEMRLHFDQARKLYQLKLRPLIARHNGITWEEAQRTPDDPRSVALRGHDRLLKTLLLAALTPEVEALRDLTADRLVALNHGSIRSPIPGAEAGMIVGLCRQWGGEVGQIRVGDDPHRPTLSIQLSSVEVESVLEKVRGHQDNQGNRKRAVRALLYEQIGVPAGGSDLFQTHTTTWRGTRRSFEVVFANIRELSTDNLRAQGEDWKVVVDFPFDAEGYTARDDLSKLQTFRAHEPDTPTFCWVPAFLSREAQRDLGNYVLVSYLLLGDRLNEEATHLSAVDRATAKGILENQQSQLKQRLISCLEAAYGVAPDRAGLVDTGLELADRFQSLDRRFQPQPPAAANLRAAFEQLLHQILAHRFPRHPAFEVEQVTPRDLRRVLEVVRQAIQSPQGRVEVERDTRPLMRQIAQPLELGEMHEAAFVLLDRWRNRLAKAAGAANDRPTVRQLRAAMDQPEALGLSRDVQDLVILVFAEQTNRSFVHGGAAVAADLGSLRDELELRPLELPDEETWQRARERAALLWGFTAPSLRTASAVGLLIGGVQEKARAGRTPASDYFKALENWLRALGVGAADSARHRTARSLVSLVEALVAAPEGRVIETLVGATLTTSGEAMARAGTSAEAGARFLREAQRTMLESLGRITDDRRSAAQGILASARDALGRDELAVPLEPALRRALDDAAALLATSAAAAPTSSAGSLAPTSSRSEEGWETVESGEQAELGAGEAEALFRRLSEALAAPRRRLRLAWSVEKRIDEP